MTKTTVKATANFLDLGAERRRARREHDQQRDIGRDQRANSAEVGVGLRQRAERLGRIGPDRSRHHPAKQVGPGKRDERQDQHADADDRRRARLRRVGAALPQEATRRFVTSMNLPPAQRDALCRASQLIQSIDINRQYLGKFYGTTLRQAPRLSIQTAAELERAKGSGPSHAACLNAVVGLGERAAPPVDLVDHDRADALAGMHQLKTPVDVVERQDVGDHRIDVDLAVHVPIDDFRHVGAAARAAEGRALPRPPGDQLEGARAISCPAPATPMITDTPQPR